MKLLFVAADFAGSSWYRIIQPAGICKELYEDALWCAPDRLNLPYLQKCDMLVVQRQCHQQALDSTKGLLKLNKVVVSEIDDNIWSIPPDTGKMAEFWTKENIKRFEEHLAISHAVTVSTPRLAKLVKQYNDKVYVVPNLVVFEKDYQKIDYHKVRIGWAGSDSHLPDFTPDIQLALLDVKEKYGEKVDIFMFGVLPHMLFTKVTFYGFIYPHLYLPELHKLGLDIGLVPNRENLFNDCRSPLKWIEYSSVKAVTIASNTDSYRNAMTNGKNGILVKKNSRKAWFHAIVEMVENEKERKRIAENAFNHCYEKHSIQENKDQYLVYNTIYNDVKGVAN